MQIKGKTAIVTGGAAGIGLEISRQLAEAGADVIIIGRNAGRLHGVSATIPRSEGIVADLARPEERAEVIHKLLTRDRPMDILINNAGTMQYFNLSTPSASQRMRNEIELDLHAPIDLSVAVLAALLQRPESAIVNITTSLIYAPFAVTPGYSAAKAGLHAFTQSLRWQTRQSSLHVMEVMPPAVDTELTRNYSGTKIRPEAVAQSLVRGLRANRAEVLPGQSRGLKFASRVAPNTIYSALNKQADREPLDA